MNSTSTRGPAGGMRQRLLEAAQRGDHAAQEELVRRFEPLVQRVVWRLRLPPYCERDDLAQEARIGLLASIHRWRPDRGPFPAFADRCVTNQALLALEAGTGRRAKWTEDATPPRLLEVLEVPCDARTDPEALVLVREQLTSVRRAIPKLTTAEQAALAGALNGQSYERLGPALGRTRKGASQAAYRARRKLAAALTTAA
jgi:RNA polymerase sigma factor (sigma-70 family)